MGWTKPKIRDELGKAQINNGPKTIENWALKPMQYFSLPKNKLNKLKIKMKMDGDRMSFRHGGGLNDGVWDYFVSH